MLQKYYGKNRQKKKAVFHETKEKVSNFVNGGGMPVINDYYLNQ